MMYVRYPLSLRNVEDLLHECGIEITHETVRFGGTILGRFSPLKSDRTEFGRCNHSSIGRLNALKRQLWCAGKPPHPKLAMNYSIVKVANTHAGHVRS